MVLGMQHGSTAIKDGFPEGVWLNALFQFLFNRRYLTVVFQGDDDLLTTKGRMNGARSSLTFMRLRLREAGHGAAEEMTRVVQYRHLSLPVH